MPEGLSAALALPGLWALLGAVFVAGTVYGFAGFGAALVFLPVGVAIVSPELAIAAFSLSAMVSLVTVVPRAWGGRWTSRRWASCCWRRWWGFRPASGR